MRFSCCVAVLIAFFLKLSLFSKCEEIFPPELKDFEYVTDNTYGGEQIKKMEMMILNTLHFEINQPSAAWFAERFVVCFIEFQKIYIKVSREKLGLQPIGINGSPLQFRG